jgi:hypothetical protein
MHPGEDDLLAQQLAAARSISAASWDTPAPTAPATHAGPPGTPTAPAAAAPPAAEDLATLPPATNQAIPPMSRSAWAPPVDPPAELPEGDKRPPASPELGTNPPRLATRLTAIHLQQVATVAAVPILWQVLFTFDQGPPLLRFIQTITPGEVASEIIILCDTVQQHLAEFQQAQTVQLAAQRALPSLATTPPASSSRAAQRGGKRSITPAASPPVAAADPPATLTPSAGPPPHAASVGVEQASLF